jgi:hypothetical protein
MRAAAQASLARSKGQRGNRRKSNETILKSSNPHVRTASGILDQPSFPR